MLLLRPVCGLELPERRVPSVGGAGLAVILSNALPWSDVLASQQRDAGAS